MYSLHDRQLEVQGTWDLLTHATDYYRNLFGPGEGNMMQFSDDVWSMEQKLTVRDIEELDKPFTKKRN